MKTRVRRTTLIRRLVLGVSLLTIPVLAGAGQAAAATTTYDWLQFDGNPSHTGDNTQETSITASNVGTLSQLFRVSLPDTADSSPVYLRSVNTMKGTINLVFVTTRLGYIIASNARTGAQIWYHQNGPGSCKINGGSNTCYTTSSPAIDPNRQYVYSYGLDGYVHKYAVGDGNEVTTGGWPELATNKPQDEKGSSALSIATASSGQSYLYVANGGYPGDNGDYQGHITAINLSSGAQQVYNANCSNQINVHFVYYPTVPSCQAQQTAIWTRAGAIYDPANNRLYVATGNGPYSPSAFNWGDSVLALNPDATGAANGNPLDSYTPADFQSLQNSDADLGSTDPALLPPISGSSYSNVAVQAGKDGELRLLNLDNLSGQGAVGKTGGELSGDTNVPQGGEVLTQPATWTDPSTNTMWVFVANDSGISGLKVVSNSSGVPVLGSHWTVSTRCTSPIIAANILYCATGQLIQALNPTTGSQLWKNTTIGGIHWQSPIVANGVLYVTDDSGTLTAFTSNAGPTYAPLHRKCKKGKHRVYGKCVR